MKTSTNKKRYILRILLSLALILLAVTVGVALRICSVFREIEAVEGELQPSFFHMIEDADVSAISVQYRNNEEFFLEDQSQIYRRTLALVKDIRVYGKRLGIGAVGNTYDCGVHIYMNDGTVHTVWLNTVTQLFGHKIAYMTLDGFTYINEPWRTEELYETVIQRVIPDQLPDELTESASDTFHDEETTTENITTAEETVTQEETQEPKEYPINLDDYRTQDENQDFGFTAMITNGSFERGKSLDVTIGIINQMDTDFTWKGSSTYLRADAEFICITENGEEYVILPIELPSTDDWAEFVFKPGEINYSYQYFNIPRDAIPGEYTLVCYYRSRDSKATYTGVFRLD